MLYIVKVIIKNTYRMQHTKRKFQSWCNVLYEVIAASLNLDKFNPLQKSYICIVNPVFSAGYIFESLFHKYILHHLLILFYSTNSI